MFNLVNSIVKKCSKRVLLTEREDHITSSRTFNVRMMAPVARSAKATANTSDCKTMKTQV